MPDAAACVRLDGLLSSLGVPLPRPSAELFFRPAPAALDAALRSLLELLGVADDDAVLAGDLGLPASAAAEAEAAAAGVPFRPPPLAFPPTTAEAARRLRGGFARALGALSSRGAVSRRAAVGFPVTYASASGDRVVRLLTELAETAVEEGKTKEVRERGERPGERPAGESGGNAEGTSETAGCQAGEKRARDAGAARRGLGVAEAAAEAGHDRAKAPRSPQADSPSASCSLLRAQSRHAVAALLPSTSPSLDSSAAPPSLSTAAPPLAAAAPPSLSAAVPSSSASSPPPLSALAAAARLERVLLEKGDWQKEFAALGDALRSTEADGRADPRGRTDGRGGEEEEEEKEESAQQAGKIESSAYPESSAATAAAAERALALVAAPTSPDRVDFPDAPSAPAPQGFVLDPTAVLAARRAAWNAAAAALRAEAASRAPAGRTGHRHAKRDAERERERARERLALRDRGGAHSTATALQVTFNRAGHGTSFVSFDRARPGRDQDAPEPSFDRAAACDSPSVASAPLPSSRFFPRADAHFAFAARSRLQPHQASPARFSSAARSRVAPTQPSPAPLPPPEPSLASRRRSSRHASSSATEVDAPAPRPAPFRCERSPSETARPAALSRDADGLRSPPMRPPHSFLPPPGAHPPPLPSPPLASRGATRKGREEDGDSDELPERMRSGLSFERDQAGERGEAKARVREAQRGGRCAGGADAGGTRVSRETSVSLLPAVSSPARDAPTSQAPSAAPAPEYSPIPSLSPLELHGASATPSPTAWLSAALSDDGSAAAADQGRARTRGDDASARDDVPPFCLDLARPAAAGAAAALVPPPAAAASPSAIVGDSEEPTPALARQSRARPSSSSCSAFSRAPGGDEPARSATSRAPESGPACSAVSRVHDARPCFSTASRVPDALPCFSAAPRAPDVASSLSTASRAAPARPPSRPPTSTPRGPASVLSAAHALRSRFGRPLPAEGRPRGSVASAERLLRERRERRERERAGAGAGASTHPEPSPAASFSGWPSQQAGEARPGDPAVADEGVGRDEGGAGGAALSIEKPHRPGGDPVLPTGLASTAPGCGDDPISTPSAAGRALLAASPATSQLSFAVSSSAPGAENAPPLSSRLGSAGGKKRDMSAVVARFRGLTSDRGR